MIKKAQVKVTDLERILFVEKCPFNKACVKNDYLYEAYCKYHIKTIYWTDVRGTIKIDCALTNSIRFILDED